MVKKILLHISIVNAVVLSTSLLMPAMNAVAIQVIPKGINQALGEDKAISEARFKANFKTAVMTYRKELRTFWPNAEVSSTTRAVFYSKQFSEKRVIDFKANEIQISTPNIRKGSVLDYRKMQIELHSAISSLLSMNMISAINNDPINRAMEQLTGIRYAQDLDTMGKDLILGELFSNERPSSKAIERMASKLTKTAYIRYPAVASLSLALNIQERTNYIVKLPQKRLRLKAKAYKPFINENAQKYRLPASLIFAIIHAESSFNPLARSQAPAFGLMQIMPYTAGKDASNLIYNKVKILSPSYLYNPKANIQVGSAYFHILYYRYLKDITDSRARMYCAIAAYNAGTGAVMTTLAGRNSIRKAVPIINKMKANDVLRKLIRQLPSAETRHYLNKVLSLKKTYAQI
ncbi:MAG: membrane-bound lytic murein transglycosylase C [Bermanella sp.]|jgi:membrane-bound lytic murein transglycosylase C